MRSKDLQITYRQIAKFLASRLPLDDDEEFGAQVEVILEEIKAMSKEQKNALRAAYIFSRKAPSEEREDLFQDLILNLLKAKASDEKLAYAIARCDWKSWWDKYQIRQHYSLDSVVEDEDGNEITLAETIVGECEWEAKMDGELDGQRIWDRLPDIIKPIVTKRLLGRALSNTERSKLNRWIKQEGYQLLA